jgi:hypothetical protein
LSVALSEVMGWGQEPVWRKGNISPRHTPPPAGIEPQFPCRILCAKYILYCSTSMDICLKQATRNNEYIQRFFHSSVLISHSTPTSRWVHMLSHVCLIHNGGAGAGDYKGEAKLLLLRYGVSRNADFQAFLNLEVSWAPSPGVMSSVTRDELYILLRETKFWPQVPVTPL